MNNNISLVLTREYAQNLVKVLDLAVKSGGLNAAITCLPIAEEIEKQLYAEPQPQAQAQPPSKVDLEAQKMVEEIIKEKSIKNKKN